MGICSVVAVCVGEDFQGMGSETIAGDLRKRCMFSSASEGRF